MRIVGCVEGREITLTRAGAHPLAHALIRKSLQTEPDMDVAIAKAIAGFNEETRAHFLTLSDTDMTAFVAKSAADQAADVEKAKKAPPPFVKKDDDADDMKKSIAEIVRSAIAPLTEQIATIEKSNKELIERDAQRTREADIERRAATEFSSFPGGPKAAADMLKSISGLDEGARASVEKAMKAQAEMAKRSGGSFGLTEDELARAAPASTELSKTVKEVAKSRNCSEPEAMAWMGGQAEYSELLETAEAEFSSAN